MTTAAFSYRVPLTPPYPPTYAPHLQRLLGFVTYAGRLRSDARPLSAADQLARYHAHAAIYDEVFDAAAPTDTEEVLLVLSLLPTLEELAAQIARFAAETGGVLGSNALGLARRLGTAAAALQLRHGISAAERGRWHTCLHTDPR